MIPSQIIPTSNRSSYAMSIIAIALCSAFAHVLRHYIDTQNLVMPYLVCVVFVAARYGRGPSVLTAILSGAAFNFLFVEPYYSFNMADQKYYVTLAFMLVAGLITSSLTSQVREQSVAIASQHQALNALYDAARALTSADNENTISEVIKHHSRAVLAADASWLSPDRLHDDAARWAFAHGKASGKGTSTLASAPQLYIPLSAQGKTIGVLALTQPKLTLDHPLLAAYTSLFASAIARTQAAQRSEQHSIEAEREKLRNTLLSAVSHDLRTPLATITGSASSLLLKAKDLPEYAVNMIESIQREASRLGRLVGNLLDATRMQAGALTINREPYYMAELIGSALSRLEPMIGNRETDIRVSNQLPLLNMDGVLIEQVMMNLLENALRYTPENSALIITAESTPYAVEIAVIDHGHGLKAGSEHAIFERFERMESKDAEGMGLGLAISKAIIEAHGGNIWARNRSEGGAAFHFTLPLALNRANVEDEAA